MSRHKKQYQSKSNIEIIVTLIIIMATTLGTTIPLYVHNSSRMDMMQSQLISFQKATTEQIQGIREEIKDFHGRLCAIEERSKGTK